MTHMKKVKFLDTLTKTTVIFTLILMGLACVSGFTEQFTQMWACFICAAICVVIGVCSMLRMDELEREREKQFKRMVDIATLRK